MEDLLISVNESCMTQIWRPGIIIFSPTLIMKTIEQNGDCSREKCKKRVCLRGVLLSMIFFRKRQECSLSIALQQVWQKWSPSFFYVVSAWKMLIVCVAWRSLKGRSLSLTKFSFGSNWKLAVLNYVSKSSLCSYLDGERYIFIAFQIWLFFDVRKCWICVQNKFNFKILGFSFLFWLSHWDIQRICQPMLDWVSFIILVVSTSPGKNYLEYLKI